MYTTLFLSVLVAAQAALATPIQARTAYAVKETHDVPRKWENKGKASGDHTLHLQIGLKQDRFEELERHLHEVSDPDHPRYGQHLSYEHIHELVKPSDETMALVHEWLKAADVSNLDYSPAKDWISVNINVKDAERLLDTEYSVYEHEDGSQMIRTPKWSLPLHLHDLIDTIQPTTSFMRSRASSNDNDYVANEKGAAVVNYKASAPSGHSTPVSKVCKFFPVTIECFRTLYGTLDYKPKVPGKNKIGFNNFLGQIPVRPDIFKFLKEWRPEAAKTALTFKSIEIANGPPAIFRNVTHAEAFGTADNWREANLDAQTILGVTYPTPVYSYSTGGSPPFNPDVNTPDNTNEPYLTWVNYVLGQKDVPQVVSTSYGDDEQSVPKAYAERVCKQFATLGARGISLLVSSGDAGVGGGNDTASCITNDGKNTTTFLPSFPASCPYVTTVGATQKFEPEISAYRFPGTGPDGRFHGFYSSGSGFSKYFSRPQWQDDVVSKYVKNLKGLNDGLYNKKGRAYPDIAAQGLYFAFVFNQTDGSISGTSASCPLASSVISLVNDALIAAGKPTLGWLNPWLYKKGYQGFTDVTIGTSYGCGGNGFPVTKGWDPVTGFGTPIFPELLKLSGAKGYY